MKKYLIAFCFLGLCGCGIPNGQTGNNSDSGLVSLTTGAQNSAGRSYSLFSPETEAAPMKEQAPPTEENSRFASYLEKVEVIPAPAGILAISIKWMGLQRNLVFQGQLQKMDNSYFAQMLDTTGQKSDLKITASCAKVDCPIVHAFITNGKNQRAGIIIRRERRTLVPHFPDGSDSKNGNLQTSDVIVTSTEILPGKSYVQVATDPSNFISGDLLETKGVPVDAEAVGRFRELGKWELVGNSEGGDLAWKVTPMAEKVQQNQNSGIADRLSDGASKIYYMILGPRPDQSKPQPPAQRPSPQLQAPVPSQSQPLASAPIQKQEPPVKTQNPVKANAAKPAAPQKDQGPQLVSQTALHPVIVDIITEQEQPDHLQIIAGYSKFWTVPNENNGKSKISNYLAIYAQSREPNPQGSASVLKRMIAVLNHQSMPAVMTLLAYIESEFKPTALSNKGAVGLWQLMPETAKDLGLKLQPDERKDVEKSTRAAAKHFQYLLEHWNNNLEMALVTYNLGEGKTNVRTQKLETQVKQQKIDTGDLEVASFSKNFWELYHYQMLPDETQLYVVHFLAGSLMALFPSDYGFEELSPIAYY